MSSTSRQFCFWSRQTSLNTLNSCTSPHRFGGGSRKQIQGHSMLSEAAQKEVALKEAAVKKAAPPVTEVTLPASLKVRL